MINLYSFVVTFQYKRQPSLLSRKSAAGNKALAHGTLDVIIS
jgi:hypothetical protein